MQAIGEGLELIGNRILNLEWNGSGVLSRKSKQMVTGCSIGLLLIMSGLCWIPCPQQTLPRSGAKLRPYMR